MAGTVTPSMTFLPRIEDALQIDGVKYSFVGASAAPGTPVARKGRDATVYQVQGSDGSLRALKVLAPEHRVRRIAESVEGLLPFASLPVLRVCARSVLTPQQHGPLLEGNPDLAYAVLMPWVEGETWQAMIESRRPISPRQSRLLAKRLASELAAMERRGLAHCDLSGSNLLISLSPVKVTLVDVEDLFGPGLARPDPLPGGSPGYAQRAAREGLWSADADRFAAAVLLAEILGWSDERVRESAQAQTYFDSEELHRDGKRYQILSKALSEKWDWAFTDAFRKAWQSSQLQECPPLSSWPTVLGGWATGPLTPTRLEPGGADAAPVSPPGPVEATVEKESLLASARALAGERRWQEAAWICGELLRSWPEDPEVRSLLTRLEQIQAIGGGLRQASEWAATSGRSQDWKSYLDQVKAAGEEAPEIEWYRELQAEAEQKLEVALAAERIEELLAGKQWEQVGRLLSRLPPNHPVGLRAEALVEQETQRRLEIAGLLREAREALQLEDWQKAEAASRQGLALGGEAWQLQPILERAEQEWITDRQVEHWEVEAAELAHQNQWKEALEKVEAALQKRPRRASLRQLRQDLLRQQPWAARVEQARAALQQKQWEEALEALAWVPPEFMQAGELQLAAQAQRDWEADLQKARQVCDAAGVLRLLSLQPPGGAAFEFLRAWAETEIHRQHELETARKAFDLDAIVRLLKQAPDDYPSRQGLLAWAESERERRRALEAARRACDPDEVFRLLASVGGEYPGGAELLNWARAERRLYDRLERALAESNWTLGEAVLAEVALDHPRRGEWRGRIERGRQLQDQWTRLREQIQDALGAGRVDEAIEAAAKGLSAGAPAQEFAPLLKQAYQQRTEEERFRQITAQARLALQRGDLREALLGVRQAVRLRPDSPESQALAADVRSAPEIGQRIERAQAAAAARKWKKALGLWQSLLDLGFDDQQVSEAAALARQQLEARRRRSLRKAALGFGLPLIVLLCAGGGWASLSLGLVPLGPFLAIASQTATPTAPATKETQSPEVSPRPSETVSPPSATATFAPTETAAPLLPTSTRTPRPTQTNTSTATEPPPSPTPSPTASPVPTATPRPPPTATLRPPDTSTPVPAPTDAPTWTPAPPDTPTWTPVPSNTPTATPPSVVTPTWTPPP